MTSSYSINKFCSLALCFAMATSVSTSWAQIMQQDAKPEPPPKNVALEYPIGELEAMTLDQLNAELDRVAVGFRQSLKAMGTAKTRYDHADKAESYGYGKTWRENAVVGQQAFQKIKELSLEIYLKAEKPTDEQFELAVGMAVRSADEGRVGIANRVFKKMLKLKPDDEDILLRAGRVAVFTNDFEIADRLLQAKPKLIEDFPREEVVRFKDLEGFEERWTKEKEIRKAEAEADDLPRVELTTSKGKIVIELFENEAPNAVGNFIHLVESGFYENAFFHQVLRNFRSQTGLAFRDRRPPTDYEIEDEPETDNARKFFRGSIVTLPKGSPAITGGFSIYAAPNPFASEGSSEIVFGRVISGMDVVDILKVNARIAKDSPVIERVKPKKGDMPDDYIVSAKVLRKRPNVDYQPKKLSPSKK